MLALADPAVVRGPVLAPPTEGFYAMAPLVVVLLLVSLLYYVRLRRARAHAPRRAGVMARFALAAALGNALVELDAMLDARRPVAMAMERGDCERIPDERGDGREPELPEASPARLVRPASHAALSRPAP